MWHSREREAFYIFTVNTIITLLKQETQLTLYLRVHHRCTYHCKQGSGDVGAVFQL